jgi:hypothetical protein
MAAIPQSAQGMDNSGVPAQLSEHFETAVSNFISLKKRF